MRDQWASGGACALKKRANKPSHVGVATANTKAAKKGVMTDATCIGKAGAHNWSRAWQSVRLA